MEMRRAMLDEIMNTHVQGAGATPQLDYDEWAVVCSIFYEQSRSNLAISNHSKYIF
jgi:hypothetical protein